MPEETTAETATTETTTTETATTKAPAETEKLTPPPELQAVIDKERQNARDAEKARKALEKELNDLRQSSMSDAEKAVSEAEARGKAAAASEFGSRLVKSDFVAAAARRNPGFDAQSVLEDLNLARFVGDDGEPDTKAIEAAVARLVPEPNSSPSFDGGARTPPPVSTGMNSLIRKAAGRA